MTRLRTHEIGCGGGPATATPPVLVIAAQVRRLVPCIGLSHGVPYMPARMDVPGIGVIWTGIPDLHAPMGAHGIGEVGITGTGAANATNTTGRHTRDLRITPDERTR